MSHQRDFFSYEDFIMMRMKREPIEKAPDCVIETVERRMAELDEQIRDYTDMVRQLEAEYAAHAQFLCSFGAGNLSHSSSENMVESPQASA